MLAHDLSTIDSLSTGRLANELSYVINIDPGKGYDNLNRTIESKLVLQKETLINAF